jgi:hypothetical protein
LVSVPSREIYHLLILFLGSVTKISVAVFIYYSYLQNFTILDATQAFMKEREDRKERGKEDISGKVISMSAKKVHYTYTEDSIATAFRYYNHDEYVCSNLSFH